jgi:hypothetical protein
MFQPNPNNIRELASTPTALLYHQSVPPANGGRGLVAAASQALPRDPAGRFRVQLEPSDAERSF